MQLQFGILATVLAALVSITGGQVHEGMGGNNHRRWLSRKWTNSNNITAIESRGQLEKRFDNAKFTFYDAGLSACGGTFSNSDFIVALNAPQFAGGALCYQTITITVNGKTTGAKIVDECMGCPWGGLDFSRGLFDFFASESEGILYGSWTLGENTPSPSTSQAPKWTPVPAAPSTTWTSTWSATSTSAKSSTSSTTTSTATTTTTTSTSTSSSDHVSETSTSSGGVVTGTIEDLYLVFVQMGRLMLL